MSAIAPFPLQSRTQICSRASARSVPWPLVTLLSGQQGWRLTLFCSAVYTLCFSQPHNTFFTGVALLAVSCTPDLLGLACTKYTRKLARLYRDPGNSLILCLELSPIQKMVPCDTNSPHNLKEPQAGALLAGRCSQVLSQHICE